MKKTIFLILISLVISFAIMADNTDSSLERSLYFGLKAGFDASLIGNNGFFTDGYFTFGIFARHDINGIFALQLELNYFGIATVINEIGPTAIDTTPSQYVQVPLLLKANYFSKSKRSPLYMDFGPVFDSLFAHGITRAPAYKSFSGIIGLGIDFYFDRGNSLELEARVDRSIVNNYMSVAHNPAFIYFTVGYIF
jgi:hypothetical protein